MKAPKMGGLIRDQNKIRSQTVDFKENQLPVGLFKMTIQLEGRAYDLILDKILSFDKENTKEWTDADINYHLEKCATYRFTFLAAAEEVKKMIQTKKRMYSAWNAAASKKAQTAILTRKKELRAEGAAASWLGSVTKQDISDWILTDTENSKVMIEYETSIEKLESDHRKLMELRSCMEERAWDLKAIGNWRVKEYVNSNPSVR